MKRILLITLIAADVTSVFSSDRPAVAATPPTSPATFFKTINTSVSTAIVVVVAPSNDPLDLAIAGYGGFPPAADITHVHRLVQHSFAVAYNNKGHPIEALYVLDNGEVQQTTDEDLLAAFAHKANHLVSSAPSGNTVGEVAASSASSGSESGARIYKVNGKTIRVGMSMTQVHALLGSPQTKISIGSGHEQWLYKPLNVGGDVFEGAVSHLTPNMGFLSLASGDATHSVAPKARTSTIVFDGTSVDRVYIDQ